MDIRVVIRNIVCGFDLCAVEHSGKHAEQQKAHDYVMRHHRKQNDNGHSYGYYKFSVFGDPLKNAGHI